MWNVTWKTAKRLVILVVGLSVMLVGIAMIVLPGPAFIVIPAGLAILATEFVWAKRLLDNIKRRAAAAVDAVRGANSSTKARAPGPSAPIGSADVVPPVAGDARPPDG